MLLRYNKKQLNTHVCDNKNLCTDMRPLIQGPASAHHPRNHISQGACKVEDSLGLTQISEQGRSSLAHLPLC
ncbi:hypothetical protein HZ326_30148 [Fusarium oxysporum f. sp. albedinis]|nr:hypothetical protein HZ326_30148 [Fusarium oxysporum f. sp. albedinis]